MSSLVGLIVASLLASACGGGDPGEELALADSGHDPRNELAQVLESSRTMSAWMVLDVAVSIDGEQAATIHTEGVVIEGGHSYDLAIDAPASFGLDPAEQQPVEVRYVDGRVFQRGPVIDASVPDANGRWVDLGLDTADFDGMGFIEPGRLAVFDLLDDVVELDNNGDVYEGTLGQVAVAGKQIASIDSAGFVLEVGEAGLTEQLVVTISSASGVEMTITVAFEDVAAVPAVERPSKSEIHPL